MLKDYLLTVWFRCASRLLLAAVVGLASFAALTVAPAQALDAQAGTFAPASAGGFWYTVRSGDTLSGISARFDVSIAGIIRANNLRNPRVIYAGQKLYLPKEPDSPVRAGASAAASQSVPVSPPAARTRGKAIYVSLSKQRMWVYENGKLLWTFPISTGTPDRATKAGVFRIKSKMDEAWSNVWQLRMPNWLGIYDVGRIENGIHAMPMTKNGRPVRWRVGTPGSFGCVVLNTKDAATLYNWATIGTLVVIRY
ncbi:MAG: L,D-transpeptidase family protein [Candidatus Roseilinea sp.]|uniref:L,D-transpeptidase family protein n=1 Tax=Candidatus Roseilinea sp. TaxID=2838777 RepID=UPI00404955BE